ncbi:MAG TPA: DUF6036 family nucleotidyltransferase [Longimicrobiaceae bacterium]|nr:DUF6036 family nucleotidyltransferase [Longimicrobiaceae bacterium]
MTRAELEHAIRAACEVSGEHTVIVFGSQSILGQYPDAPPDLRQSLEADIAPGSGDPEAADRMDAVLGENSSFHRTHGFYVHGLTIDAAYLPRGWERRTITLRNAGTDQNEGRCIEAHDLAASKLAAFRDKDRAFVRVLLAEGLVKIAKLKLRLTQLDRSNTELPRMLRWVDLTVGDLAGRDSDP